MRSTSQHLKRVQTIRNDASAHAAARAMRYEAVGCLVVVNDDEVPVGIVTDRDLALRAVATSHEPHGLAVADIMSRELVTTTPDTPMHDVLQLMKARGIRRIPVMDDGELAGIVALDDVLEELSRDIRELAAEAPRRYRTAPSSSRFEHVRHGIERGLEDLRSKLEYAQWYARETLVDELDELRDRLRLPPHSGNEEDGSR